MDSRFFSQPQCGTQMWPLSCWLHPEEFSLVMTTGWRRREWASIYPPGCFSARSVSTLLIQPCLLQEASPNPAYDTGVCAAQLHFLGVQLLSLPSPWVCVHARTHIHTHTLIFSECSHTDHWHRFFAFLKGSLELYGSFPSSFTLLDPAWVWVAFALPAHLYLSAISLLMPSCYQVHLWGLLLSKTSSSHTRTVSPNGRG